MSGRSLIYLASRSPRRRMILREMGVPFRVIPSRYVERRRGSLSPSKLVVQQALGKALKARIPRRRRKVLAADTIVYCSGRIIGKPRTKREAFRMLKFLSGRTHWVYTGVALYDPATGKVRSGYAKTQVVFRKFSNREIWDYIERVRPLDKAGSYAIQEGREIVQKIHGSYTNVVGLPTALIKKLLREMDFDRRKLS